MSVGVKVEVMSSAVKKTHALKNLPLASGYQLAKWGSEFEKYLKQVAVRGKYVGKYKGGVQTGALRRSIKHKVTKEGDRYRLEVGSVGSPYARILERGGIIRPKTAQWLTIPMKGVRGKARDHEGAFFIKSKKGNLLLVKKKGKKGIQPLYVLKKKVKIPRFAWLEKSYGDRKGKLMRMMSERELFRVAGRMR